MECPKCKQSNYAKDGKVMGRQRYKCRVCNFRYSVVQKADIKPPEVKVAALEMYHKGLSFRAVGRILKISYGTVYKWVKAAECAATTEQQMLPDPGGSSIGVTIDVAARTYSG